MMRCNRNIILIFYFFSSIFHFIFILIQIFLHEIMNCGKVVQYRFVRLYMRDIISTCDSFIMAINYIPYTKFSHFKIFIGMFCRNFQV